MPAGQGLLLHRALMQQARLEVFRSISFPRLNNALKILKDIGEAACCCLAREEKSEWRSIGGGGGGGIVGHGGGREPSYELRRFRS
jgi:hypothetical protein